MLCKFPVMDILQSFVPPLVAAHLGQDAPSRPWGERFEAVIVFADISAPCLAESPARHGGEGTERMSALLDDYFSELFGLVEQQARGQHSVLKNP